MTAQDMYDRIEVVIMRKYVAAREECRAEAAEELEALVMTLRHFDPIGSKYLAPSTDPHVLAMLERKPD